MEDVRPGSKRRLWCLCLVMFALFLVQSNLNAATQGTVGGSGSRGNISISLEIPQVTRVSAELDQDPLSEQAQLCLHMSNDNSQTPIDFYTLAGLNGDISPRYGAGISAYEKFSKLIKLNNTNVSPCSYRTDIKSNKNNQALLLMVIAE